MNETQKTQAKQAHSKLTTWLTGLGVSANWAKVGSALIIGAAIGALSTCQQSCKSVPHARLTTEQVQTLETVYTTLGGQVRYRIIPVEPIKK